MAFLSVTRHSKYLLSLHILNLNKSEKTNKKEYWK